MEMVDVWVEHSRWRKRHRVDAILTRAFYRHWKPAHYVTCCGLNAPVAELVVNDLLEKCKNCQNTKDNDDARQTA
jgi:hypothetical protein